MNSKGEAIGRALRGLAEVETIVRSLGRMPEGTAYRERVVEARKALDAVDRALKDLGKKSVHACQLQGCYELATRRHYVDDLDTTIILCDEHSATSRHPEVK